MGDGGGPESLPCEKTNKRTDTFLTCSSPQEEARNTRLLTTGPAGPLTGQLPDQKVFADYLG